MARLDTAPKELNIDMAPVRTQVKRVYREAKKADQMLAAVEAQIGGYAAELASRRITLEVD